jgi:hypothetical protein
MNEDDEILRLKEQIKELEEKKMKEAVKKYQWMVGECIHDSATSFSRITSVYSVDLCDSTDVENIEQYDTIYYESINIYYSDFRDKNPLDEIVIRIDTSGYGEIYLGDFERYKISKEEFEKALEKAIEKLRLKLLK